ncbi:MAG: bifunctional 4-hydroxy-2-oxoglutarate aldolase/2-dehydro-3-deoxy-phosphogluconate aldolase [Candidatus Hydrogenedentes bacterium]|nr:bifunctional 4-hydroxy-2-oxoglutarate aldolase/2-dehydro-3-deoxy-phosphogluconate aldolase [Candidatus Hydrogenedentota bacterium]
MERQAAIEYIKRHCIVAVVRADSGGEDLVRIVEAVAEGGVRCIELTMTTPGALPALELATKKLADADVLLGVGTVLDAETCRVAILSGAQFIVTPTVAPDVARMARRYGRPVALGAFTPTEILAAWEAGSDAVKVFPSSVGGPDYIKAIKGPLPQIPLLPTGGVEVGNVAEFLKAGAFALGVGGNLVSKKLVDAKDFAGLTRNAKAFADAVAAARAK